MGLKTKLTMLLLNMLLLISSQVKARHLKEGEVVRETNIGARDAKLVGDGGNYFVGNIPGMIGGGGYMGGGNNPGMIGGGGYMGGGNNPGMIGAGIIPGIIGNIIPGIVGNIIPGIGGGNFLGGGGGGYEVQGGYGGVGYCRYGCCGVYGADYCSRCCLIN